MKEIAAANLVEIETTRTEMFVPAEIGIQAAGVTTEIEVIKTDLLITGIVTINDLTAVIDLGIGGITEMMSENGHISAAGQDRQQLYHPPEETEHPQEVKTEKW